MAINTGEIATMEVILEAGGDVNIRGGSGRTPLQLAVLRGNYVAIETLLKRGADVNAKDNSGKTAASYARTVNILKLLQTQGGQPTEHHEVSHTCYWAADALRAFAF
jgi:ankyrin repeat protein